MQCRASACADHLTEQRVAQQYVWSFAPGHGHRACRPGGVHTAMVLAGWAAVGPEFAALETDYPAAPRALTEGQRLALSRALGSAVGRRLTHIGGLEVEELAIVPAGRWVTIGTHAKGAATAIQREVSDPLALPVACRNRVSGEWHLTTKHHVRPVAGQKGAAASRQAALCWGAPVLRPGDVACGQSPDRMDNAIGAGQGGRKEGSGRPRAVQPVGVGN